MHRFRLHMFACLARCLGPLIFSTALAGPWTDLNPGGGGARFTAIGGGAHRDHHLRQRPEAGPTAAAITGSPGDAIGADRGLQRTHVSAVGFDPLDAQIIHLGTEVGIYRSTNGGDTFQPTLATGYIGAVAPRVPTPRSSMPPGIPPGI